MAAVELRKALLQAGSLPDLESMKQKLGVILATRGLVFTEVEMAIEENLRGFNYRVYRSFNLKIPDCQNVLAEQALKDRCTDLLFIEEDTVMPENGMSTLLLAEADIACIDYGVAGYSCITRSKTTDEILWCGLGCTLIKRHVFERMDMPYFKDDKLLLNFWPEVRWQKAGWQEYGGQDIYFCVKAREYGFVIKQAEGECRHLKLDELGRREVNTGLHQISEKPRVTKQQTL